MESIYDISLRYKAITGLLEDETISQEDINNALMEVMDDVVSKGENGIIFLRKQEAMIEAAKNEKKKIDAYIKRREAVVKRTKQAYLYAMQQMGMKSIQTARGEIKVKTNPPAVVIDDVALLPEDYKHTTITVTPDKPAIKTAIRNGETVPGAHLEQAVSLSY
jgi:hypothetical protein